MATQNVNSNTMKYLIKESQINNVVFWYLDNQDFIQIEKNNRIYFVNSESDKYAQIRYDKSDGWCNVNYDLIQEISSFFSLQESDSKEVIGMWVENTLQMKVKGTLGSSFCPHVTVENTLQMKVKGTNRFAFLLLPALRIPSK